MKHEVMKDPRITACELKKLHPNVLDVSKQIIQEWLQKGLGLPTFRPADKPLLTKQMKRNRVAFAHKYKDWTPEQWNEVLFSNETSFSCIRAWPGKVRHPKNSNCYLPMYTSKTMKPPSIMV